ncbi:hypothetical protein [Clostridium sp.]|uniref:hypothetical protein n=1 Tax=Clostridium sp. TaxID=1506 RepID=UPI003217769E
MNSLDIDCLLKDKNSVNLDNNIFNLENPLVINRDVEMYGNKAEIIGKVIISANTIVNSVVFSNKEDYIVLIESDSNVTFNNCEFIGSNNIGIWIIEGIKCSVNFNNCSFNNLSICIKANDRIEELKLDNSQFSFCKKGIEGLNILNKTELIQIKGNSFFCDNEFIFLNINCSEYREEFYKFIYTLSESNNYIRITGIYLGEVFDTRRCFVENENQLKAAIKNCKNAAIICLNMNRINATIELNKPTYLVGVNSTILNPDPKLERQSAIVINSDGIIIKNIIIDGGEYYQFRDGIKLLDNVKEFPNIEDVAIKRVERRGISFWTSKKIDFSIDKCSFEDLKGQCAIYTSSNINISRCSFNNVSIAIKVIGNYKSVIKYCEFENVNICITHPSPSFKSIKGINNKYNMIKAYFMKLK